MLSLLKTVKNIQQPEKKNVKQIVNHNNIAQSNLQNGKQYDEKKREETSTPIHNNNNNHIVNESKKIHKDKHKWNEEFVLIKVEPPIKVPEKIGAKKSKKRFSIRITYLDKNGAKHAKTVRFGDKNLKDFIDSNADLKLKMSRNSQLRHAVSDPFHKSFWRLNLLNNRETIGESYNEVIKELGLI